MKKTLQYTAIVLILSISNFLCFIFTKSYYLTEGVTNDLTQLKKLKSYTDRSDAFEIIISRIIFLMNNGVAIDEKMLQILLGKPDQQWHDESSGECFRYILPQEANYEVTFVFRNRHLVEYRRIPSDSPKTKISPSK